MPGVVNTTVGYTGGYTKMPTYKTVCGGDGHYEAVKVEFDPSVVTYQDLIKKVLQQADNSGRVSQYGSAVFTTSDKQMSIAKTVAEQLGKTNVPIKPALPWTDAEDYHQHYLSQRSGAYCSR